MQITSVCLPNTGPKQFKRGDIYFVSSGQGAPEDISSYIMVVDGDGPEYNEQWRCKILRGHAWFPYKGPDGVFGGPNNWSDAEFAPGELVFIAQNSGAACRSRLLTAEELESERFYDSRWNRPYHAPKVNSSVVVNENV